MSAIKSLLQDIPVPRMLHIRQIFDDTHIPAEEIPAVIRR